MHAYTIARPPLVDTFLVPSDKLLLSQKPGAAVKLIFQVADETPERMWVTVTDTADPSLWRGTIDTDAAQPKTRKALPADMEVSFHPRDIIEVWEEN